MTYLGSGQELYPGMTAVNETQEANILYGRTEWAWYETAQLISSAVDAGNTPTTLLRPGLVLGRITASKLLTAWNPDAVDGSQYVFGILTQQVNMLINGTATAKLTGKVLVRGGLKAANILIEGVALSGHTYESTFRNQAAKNFLLDDNIGLGQGPWREYQIIAADRVVALADQDVMFVCKGGSGAVNFTLPATALAGMRYGFYNAQDQNMTITAGTADKIVSLNDLAADSVALSTSSEKIGGSFEVIGMADGTWLVIPHLWEAQTVTVVTA